MAEPTKRPPNRLPKPAKDLLETFYKGHKYPTPSQKIALLQQIQQIPGCEDYSKPRLVTWFNTKRAKDAKQEKEKEMKPNLTGEHTHANRTHAILYPSIKTKQLEELTALYTEHNAIHQTPPSANTLSLWARVMGVVVGDLVNWVDEKIALQKTSATALPQAPSSAAASSSLSIEPPLFVNVPSQTRSLSQLPTPSQSTSPEPIAGPSCTIKPEPPLSPTINNTPSSHIRSGTLPHDFNPPDYREKDQTMTNSETVNTYLPSPVSPCFPEEHFPAFIRRTTKTHPSSQTNPVNALDPNTSTSRLMDRSQVRDPVARPLPIPPEIKSFLFQKARASQPPPAFFPQNSSEFNTFFQPHEAKIRTLVQQISNGSLQHVGWDPGLASNLSTVPSPPLFTPKRC